MNDMAMKAFVPNLEKGNSLIRIFWLATSRPVLNIYIASFKKSVPDINRRIELAEQWIELVASRSQTLLQFNSIIIAVLALAGTSPKEGQSAFFFLATIWGIFSLPLLYNIFIFLGPPSRYENPEIEEFPFTLRNAAIRSLILNSTLIFSAAMASLAACIALIYLRH